MGGPTWRRRVVPAARHLWAGQAALAGGVRFLLWCATALWVPVLLLPGDTTARADAYATIVWLAARAQVPGFAPWLSPAEATIAALAGALAAFSAVDYLGGGSRLAPARVWLASIFWVGLAAAALLANPIGYATWLFVGIALLHRWCLARARV